MPREWSDIVRKSDTENPLKIFVLAYEGTVVEPKYFEAIKDDAKFNDELIHLESLKRRRKDGRSDPKNVFKKLKAFYDQQKEDYNFKNSDEFWMIIDRDSWNCLEEIVSLCKSEDNFFLALSNPCFEFWLLLHIQDIEGLSNEEKDKILKNEKISSHKNYIDVILGGYLEKGYNKFHPKIHRFIPNIKQAIEGGKKLNNDKEDYPVNIGSHVYKIIEKIIN